MLAHGGFAECPKQKCVALSYDLWRSGTGISLGVILNITRAFQSSETCSPNSSFKVQKQNLVWIPCPLIATHDKSICQVSSAQKKKIFCYIVLFIFTRNQSKLYGMQRDLFTPGLSFILIQQEKKSTCRSTINF